MVSTKQLLLRWGNVSLLTLVAAGSSQALAVWASLYMQVGFDSHVLGLSDAGSFMSALRRALVQLLLDVPGAVLNVDAVVSPVRAACRHWKRVEPYEFRIPVPEKVVEAFCGVFLEIGDFTMLNFLSRPSTSGYAWAKLWPSPGEISSASGTNCRPVESVGSKIRRFDRHRPSTC